LPLLIASRFGKLGRIIGIGGDLDAPLITELIYVREVDIRRAPIENTHSKRVLKRLDVCRHDSAEISNRCAAEPANRRCASQTCLEEC
jgi:hypothetical protein